VRWGDLDDLAGLRTAALDAEGVIHLAYRHDLDDFVQAAESGLRVVEAIGTAFQGSNMPFVITSGTLLLAAAAPGRLGTEEDVLDHGPRVDSENSAVALAERGVRASVVRLAPLVYSSLDHHGFAHRLINTARDKGVSAYVGDGSNRWPALHTLDAARLYRLALESAPPSSRLHGVGDEGVSFRAIAEVIGRHLNVPVASIPPERASDHFGFLGPFVALDNPTSSRHTQALLGWQPTHAGLIEDLDEGHYFGP
jgi:nucleoside-diphosphate-sugar epimerase